MMCAELGLPESGGCSGVHQSVSVSAASPPLHDEP